MRIRTRRYISPYIDKRSSKAAIQTPVSSTSGSIISPMNPLPISVLMNNIRQLSALEQKAFKFEARSKKTMGTGLNIKQSMSIVRPVQQPMSRGEKALRKM
jgi:hypothetical protein